MTTTRPDLLLMHAPAGPLGSAGACLLPYHLAAEPTP